MRPTPTSLRFLPRRRALAALAAPALLAACGALPDKPQRATLYDFGPGLTATPPAAGAPLPALTLGDMESNVRLDGTQLLYRLGYANDNELKPYAQARWSVPPAQLMHQRLREVLSAQRPVLGLEEAASLARGEGRTPDTLRVTLDEFSHYFQSPGASVGLVRLHATLVRSGPGGDRVLAQRAFTVQRPAPSGDAVGGVKALAAAADALAVEIAQWVAQPR